jgi:hypothetical protein
MTNTAATIDIVANAAQDSLSVAREIDELVDLQTRMARLEAMAREMRARIKEALIRFDVDSITSPTGHKATLSTTTRNDIDRRRALELLSPAVVAEISRTTVITVLRVR